MSILTMVNVMPVQQEQEGMVQWYEKVNPLCLEDRV